MKSQITKNKFQINSNALKILTIIIILYPMCLFSQARFEAGIHGALEIFPSSLSPYKHIAKSYGLKANIALYHYIIPEIDLQTGFLLSNKSYEWAFLSPTYIEKAKYYEIPLFIKINYSLENSKYVFLSFGPTFYIKRQSTISINAASDVYVGNVPVSAIPNLVGLTLTPGIGIYLSDAVKIEIEPMLDYVIIGKNVENIDKFYFGLGLTMYFRVVGKSDLLYENCP